MRGGRGILLLLNDGVMKFDLLVLPKIDKNCLVLLDPYVVPLITPSAQLIAWLYNYLNSNPMDCVKSELIHTI